MHEHEYEFLPLLYRLRAGSVDLGFVLAYLIRILNKIHSCMMSL
jgi:hypothetical protein